MKKVFSGWSVVLAALLAQAGALGAEWYMDDYLHILHNQNFKDGLLFVNNHRLVTIALWSVAHSLVGFSPVAFHALNLAFHGINTWLVWRCLRWMLASVKTVERRDHRWVAWLAALIFAVHPLATEPLNYAVCLTQGIALTWCLAAGIIGIKLARKVTIGSLLSLGFTILLAAHSKDGAYVPALLSATSLWLIAGGFGPFKRWLSQLSVRSKWLVGSTLGLLLLALAPYAIKVIRYEIEHSHVMTIHWLTQGRMLWRYVGLFFWPQNLCVDHHIAVSLGWSDTAGTVALILALMALVGLPFVAWKSVKWRLPLTFFWLGLAIMALRFLHYNNEHLVEYRSYWALPWWCAGLICSAFLLLKKFKISPMAIVGVGAILFLAGAGASWLRSTVWWDTSQLASAAAKLYPFATRPLNQIQGKAMEGSDWPTVIALNSVIVERVAAVTAWNQEHKGRRGYDSHRSYSAKIHSISNTAMAFMAIGQKEKAQNLVDQTLEQLVKDYPDAITPTSNAYELMGMPLLNAKNFIEGKPPVRRFIH